MRVLLIEKKEWSSKYEELKLNTCGSEGCPQSRTSCSFNRKTDVEKIEVNLRKAFGLEKQRLNFLVEFLHIEIDEHKASLDSKTHEFDLEIDQKRKCLDDQLSSRVIGVGKKEVEINHKEETIANTVLVLDKKLEKIKEKEKDFESKVKALKEKEKTMRSEETNMETEKKQWVA
ncbi:hypothetical protein Dsin_030760 [Dipteronia sinensis]|uniref:Uncharacterized protein n=1 Tax=Dipteronia sinensis TaxID=43782 RepID=A0AAD9ZLJ4_9ROSI|nr:hypothetical protein Dsin_030760 [Dipteronia sinensis]